jgi:hypothetical protein
LSGFGHCRVRSGLLSNRWWVVLKFTCENQPLNNSNPLQKETKTQHSSTTNSTCEGPVTKLKFFLVMKRVVKVGENIMERGEIEKWGFEEEWGGRRWCFVVVCGDWE